MGLHHDGHGRPGPHPRTAPGRRDGVFAYDLETEGSTSLLGVRLDLPLLPYLGVELGLEHARYRAERESPDGVVERMRVPLLLGDLQIQARYPLERVSPFLGLGIGGSLDLRDERKQEKFASLTYTFAGGVRAEVPGLSSCSEKSGCAAWDGWRGMSRSSSWARR